MDMNAYTALNSLNLELANKHQVLASFEQELANKHQLLIQQQQELERKQQEFYNGVSFLSQREQLILQREQLVIQREQAVIDRERAVFQREQAASQREQNVAAQSQQLSSREQAVMEHIYSHSQSGSVWSSQGGSECAASVSSAASDRVVYKPLVKRSPAKSERKLEENSEYEGEEDSEDSDYEDYSDLEEQGGYHPYSDDEDYAPPPLVRTRRVQE